jgi:hypothetical protein
MVTVSYECLPSTFDFRLLEPELLAQVPLRNLHWKSTNRSIRTIQQLPIQFKPLSALNDDRLPLLEKPYLHLLFVISDVSTTPTRPEPGALPCTGHLTEELTHTLEHARRTTKRTVPRCGVRSASGWTGSRSGATTSG